ncbi:hypothetical protein BS50DRAFT_575647 [Corynespora cassiicola Philippines]|uniref:CWH43-like N-terminal domain-containing protein n=1 Tax=Corynespora cassiicola Philippines TaxID=1448308 RepID=A0A2T2NJU2_CORCC|nr:hypothetical protein BS50DRAFT_575647 [Corynespora cassiicola Philippines]
MWVISYWIIPIFSSLVWLAMLIAMLVTWSVQGSPHYSSMNERQTIAYISGKLESATCSHGSGTNLG